ncbi:hypothetical protein bcere0022_9860 [Bacillus cereus Rock3-44]|nr:hypothetical protein bcere0022_9860 [Bacillus cereus Rock3-44]
MELFSYYPTIFKDDMFAFSPPLEHPVATNNNADKRIVF